MRIRKRASGILLHVSSLPSKFGIGDLGPWAFKLLDLMSESKQNYWQILPLTPSSIKYGNSPYITSSTFAGNELLLSPEQLENEGLLPDLLSRWLRDLSSKKVDYNAASEIKDEILQKAYKCFREKIRDYSSEFETFCAENSKWLDDYVLFNALKMETGRPWYLWPPNLRDRERRTLDEKMSSLRDRIELEKFAQFIFFRQWHSLREYGNKKGLSIIGDLPIYVSYDSADVWAHPEIFKLDIEKRPLFISGVPPDYYSDTGQLWGTPVYDWEQLKATNFEWWMERIEHNLKLFDVLRIDHFRGLLAYWEVQAHAKTAIDGRWVNIPSEEFFKTLVRYFPDLPFIAEDLGTITDDVREAMSKFNIPGMKVLIFAFGGSSNNPYLPHNHSLNSIVYTGTHDTNTVRGWFNKEATPMEKNMLFKYVGREIPEEEVSWEFIKLAMMSIANLSILPMQDVLSLGTEARMNRPSQLLNNWEWKITAEQLMENTFSKLREITETFGR